MLSHFLFILYFGWCYCQVTVADVIARVVADVIARVVADVIAILTWWILLPHMILWNVSITLAGVIAKLLLWQILLPYILWWMLLPLFVTISFFCKVADVIVIMCGRWKTTKCLNMMLADVIAMVVYGITTQGGFYLADVIAMVADGITTGQLYFNLSSKMFNRISSHMCGRWNLPTFLFRDWLLAFM